MEILRFFHNKIVTSPEEGGSTAFHPDGFYLAETASDIQELSEKGVDFTHVFYIYGSGKADALEDVFERCRLLADSYEALCEINEAAVKFNRPGYLQTVGLCIVSEKYGGSLRGIPEGSLKELSEAAKKLSGISVKGCFILAELSSLPAEELAAYFHEAYQIAKRTTVIMPCTMPYFCLWNILPVLERLRKNAGDAYEDIRTAMDLVDMQNNTAFYAKFLMT